MTHPPKRRLRRARQIASGPLLFEIKDGLILGRNILASLALDGMPARWPRHTPKGRRP